MLQDVRGVQQRHQDRDAVYDDPAGCRASDRAPRSTRPEMRMILLFICKPMIRIGFFELTRA